MAVTLACTLQVPLRQLRAAIAAVVPHAEPTKTGDEISSLSRVRFIAAKDELLLAATCTHTTALAAVRIEEDSRAERFAADDSVFSVDMPPGVLRRFNGMFQASRATADGIDEMAELTFGTDGELVLTDVSGLFPGLSITVPTLDLAHDFPDIVGIMSKAFSGANYDAKPLVAKGRMFALFNAAATAYGAPLQFEPTGSGESRGYIVLCGPSFSGAISSGHNDDDSLNKRDTDRRKHLARLGLAGDLKSVAL
jgi:hypothetical protein